MTLLVTFFCAMIVLIAVLLLLPAVAKLGIDIGLLWVVAFVVTIPDFLSSLVGNTIVRMWLFYLFACAVKVSKKPADYWATAFFNATNTNA